MLRCLQSSQLVETFALCKVSGIHDIRQQQFPGKIFFFKLNQFINFQVDIKSAYFQANILEEFSSHWPRFYGLQKALHLKGGCGLNPLGRFFPSFHNSRSLVHFRLIGCNPSDDLVNSICNIQLVSCHVLIGASMVQALEHFKDS